MTHRLECTQNQSLISAVQAHPYIKLEVLLCCSTEGQYSWGTARSQSETALVPGSYSQTWRPSGTKVLCPDKKPGCKFVFDRITTLSMEVNGDIHVEMWHKEKFSGGRERPASQLVSSPLSGGLLTESNLRSYMKWIWVDSALLLIVCNPHHGKYTELYTELGTTASLSSGEAETELMWAQPAYQTLRRGPTSQTCNVLSGSVQKTQHFQGTTLTSEWRELQRAASSFNTIPPKHSRQDVNSVFPVGVSLGNQCDANTEKHVEFHKERTILK